MTMWNIERLSPEEDLDGVLEVESASFANPWTRDMYAWELQNPDVSHVFVLKLAGPGAEPGGASARIAGFCSFWLVFDELHINNLAVRPEYRGRGFGTALLRHSLAEGARLGARRATLEVRRSNLAARRLYERMGFEVTGTRRTYYANPVEDALILWRRALTGLP